MSATATVFLDDSYLELDSIVFYSFGISGRGTLTPRSHPDDHVDWFGVIPWHRITEVVFVGDEA